MKTARPIVMLASFLVAVFVGSVSAQKTVSVTVPDDAVIDIRVSPPTVDAPVEPPEPTEPTEPISPPGPGPGNGVGGMGLGPVEYWTRQWSFTDLFLLSDAWRDNNTAYMHTSGHLPGGPYVLTWTGTGTITVAWGATATSTAPHRVELTIDPDGGGIEIKRHGMVSNVHLMPALDGAPGGSAFNPTFVERLRPFKVIRFMDWQRVNNQGTVSWATRTLSGDSQSTGKGVAIEHMVDLANELGADAWFCMPHLAGDQYVREFARLVKARLHPGAKIYIEWSNEVWNTQFKQTQWLEAEGGGLYTTAFFETWAEEAHKDFTIWREEFHGSEDRIVRVLATHLQNPWVAKEIMRRMPGGSYDALSPSAYFGLTSDQQRDMPANITVEQLAAIISDNIDGNNAGWYADHAARAQNAGVDLIAYEAGQHLSANGQTLPWTQTMLDLQTSPLMYDLTRQNMAAFDAATRGGGGGLMVAYNDVSKPDLKWGQFGYLEYQDQPIEDAPKYRAITSETE